MSDISIGEIVAVVVALASLVVALIAFMRKNPQATPAELDAEATRRVVEAQANRELVDRLERAYQQNSAAQQKAFDTVAGLLRLIAPLTPLKLDDAAVSLLTDIQKPGAPSVVKATPPAVTDYPPPRDTYTTSGSTSSIENPPWGMLR